MPTASELATAVASAQQALAQADLATLQTFAEQANTGTFTLPVFNASFSALAQALGDPSRTAQVSGLVESFNGILNQFEALVAATEVQAKG